MKTTPRAQIGKKLTKFRVKFQKAKEKYQEFILPGDTFIVDKKRKNSFRAQILKTEIDYWRALIRIARSFLEEGEKK